MKENYEEKYFELAIKNEKSNKQTAIFYIIFDLAALIFSLFSKIKSSALYFTITFLFLIMLYGLYSAIKNLKKLEEERRTNG